MYLNPLFQLPAVPSDPEDMGVIALDMPISDITPATLPAPGLLSGLFKAGSLSNTLFTTVGYGTTDTEFGGGAPDTFEGRRTRRSATEGFTALNPDLVRLDQNLVFGFGGSSRGDSGGPNFLAADSTETNILVGITRGGDPLGIS